MKQNIKGWQPLSTADSFRPCVKCSCSGGVLLSMRGTVLTTASTCTCLAGVAAFEVEFDSWKAEQPHQTVVLLMSCVRFSPGTPELRQARGA